MKNTNDHIDRAENPAMRLDMALSGSNIPPTTASPGPIN